MTGDHRDHDRHMVRDGVRARDCALRRGAAAARRERCVCAPVPRARVRACVRACVFTAGRRSARIKGSGGATFNIKFSNPLSPVPVSHMYCATILIHEQAASLTASSSSVNFNALSGGATFKFDLAKVSVPGGRAVRRRAGAPGASLAAGLSPPRRRRQFRCGGPQVTGRVRQVTGRV
jgi:hypothetical protein